MRWIRRTSDRGLVRGIALVCLADMVVGASFGVTTVGAGLPVWLPVLLSVVVFAGAAQFLFVGLLAAGSNPVAAMVAGLLVNLRLVPLGFAVGDLLDGGRLRRALGAHLVVDETVAFALAQRDPDRRRTAYWACGLSLFVCWNVGVLLGAVGGTVVRDPGTLGLDAAFPAVLLALVMPSLRDSTTRRAALVGVVIALGTGPFLPAGLPLLLALTGVLTALGEKPQRIYQPRDSS